MKFASISEVPDESYLHGVDFFLLAVSKAEGLFLPGPFDVQSLFGLLHQSFRNQVCEPGKPFPKKHANIWRDPFFFIFFAISLFE
jgi:hypothetical protein